MTTNVILSDYFDIHPLGVEVCPGIVPPWAAWEALVYYLASKNEEINWQVGATCNRYPKKYHADIYGWFASLLNRSPYTIEQWAHVERSVPYRVPGLSMSHHKAVTKVPLELQQEYLETCLNAGMSVSRFRDWLTEQGQTVEDEHYQSDRDFAREQAELETANRLADTQKELEETRRERDELRAKMVSSPEITAPATLAELDSLAGPIRGWFSQQQTYSRVIIYRDGRIEARP